MGDIEASSKSPVGSPVGEAILLAAFSAYAYLVTFAYEAGFCKFFGIPNYLIEISLTNLLVVAAVLYALFGSSFVLGGLMIYATMPSLDPMHPIALRLKRLFIPALLLLGYVALRTEHIGWLLGVFAVLIIAEFVVPIILHRKIKGYLEKLRHDDRTAYGDTPLIRMAGKLGHTWYLGIILAVILIGLSYDAGQFNAKSQKIFMTIDSNLVVLRRYGDALVCARLLSNGPEIEPRIVLVIPDAKEKLVLEQNEIGPLIVKKRENQKLSPKM